MAGEGIMIPNKFPVLNLTASSMVFPHVMSQIFLRSPSGQDILNEALNDRCPYLFVVMAKPDVQEIPDRWHEIGIVASLEVVQENSSVMLTGLYRAEAVKWERGTSFDNRAKYWIAKVKKLEDNDGEFFVQKDGSLTVKPEKELFFKTVFSRLKKLMKRFVEASVENNAACF